MLSSAIFDAIGPSLDKKEFVLGKKAKDGNDHIIVNQKKGTIAYDDDGKGGEKAVVFATVEKGLKLAYHRLRHRCLTSPRIPRRGIGTSRREGVRRQRIRRTPSRI